MSPETALSRIYRVRVRGHLKPEDIAALADGIVVDGVNYRGAEFVEEYDGSGRSNTWYRVVLTEGKNREIRKLMEHFGCVVNRLIRVQYGPFYLGKLQSGALEEIEPVRVAELLKYLEERGVRFETVIPANAGIWLTSMGLRAFAGVTELKQVMRAPNPPPSPLPSSRRS